MPYTKQTPQSEYSRVMQLMKDIGSKSGFDPLPPDQHRWMTDPDQPPLQRVWSWLIGHTVHWGHRSAYATDKTGIELHIEHIAADLNMEAANVYRTWRQGVDRGIWRSGTLQEGTRRLYLTGKVPKFSGEIGESEANPIVCTDNSLRSLFAKIDSQIRDFDENRKKQLRDSLEAQMQLSSALAAATAAAIREITIEKQDTILRDFGIDPPSHQTHQKKDESPEDAEARRKRLEPLKPLLKQYEPTVKEFMERQPTPAPAPQVVPDRPTKQFRQPKIATPPAPAVQTSPLTLEEKHAESLIFSEIAAMQQGRFKHMNWSKEIISPKRKSDRLFAHRVIAAVGPESVEQFLQKVSAQLHNLDKAAFGKLPGHAPAPRSLGLILQWANEYGDHLDEAARIDAEARKRWKAREIAACQEILADPNETADAKIWARELIQKHESQAV